MSRLVNRPVPVAERRDGAPLAFSFRGRHRVARVLEAWREAGEWWEGHGERQVYRVETEGGGVFELLFDLERRDWTLTRNYD